MLDSRVTVFIWILLVTTTNQASTRIKGRHGDQDESMESVPTSFHNATVGQKDVFSRHHVDEWGRAEEGIPGSTACGFECVEDKLCIAAHKVCNNYIDCTDSSDEQLCTCKERVGLAKICDGFEDCPDAEDERSCGCADNEFACKAFERDTERTKCISILKKCDGNSDCTFGDDEDNCFRLSPLDDDEDGIVSVGFLEKRIGDEWFLVCKGAKPDNLLSRYVDKVCNSIVGETQEAPHYSRKIFTSKMTKRFKDRSFALLGESDNKFVKLNGPCPSKSVIAVDCPVPECGWPAGSIPPSSRAKRHSGDFEDVDKLGELTAKIVGGQDSKPGSWPSIVGIYRNGTFHCGGSIIDHEWILTAAHCFHNYEKYVFEVQAGMLRRYSYSPTEQCRQVTNIYVHERYDSKIFLNDIALMKLDHPLQFTKWASTACLVRSDQAHLDPHAGQSCMVTGWGDIAESVRGPDQMQEVSLPVIPKCVETFTKDTMQICAGFKEGGRDACQGDSGGPFSCSDDKGRHIVAGIVSFGRGCARPNQPGVYTRVSHYTTWIDSVVSETNPIIKTQVPPLQCGHEKCRKSGGECLFPKMLCDRKVDCIDGSDEIDCDFSNIENFHTDIQVDERAYTEVAIADHSSSEHTHAFGRAKLCGPSEFQCSKTKTCVPESARCDGIFDCFDSTDEKFCECGLILANRFPHLKCDSFKHCFDGSDEFESECNFCNGAQGQVKCPLSTKCISERNWCDGTKQCPDGEDEVDCIRLVTSKSVNLVQRDFLGDKISRGLQSGVVVVREKGTSWTPACAEDTDDSITEVTCSYLGFSSPSGSRKRREERIYISRPLPKPSLELLGRSSDAEPMKEVSEARNCTPVKVSCGELQCGIEKLYTLSRRNPPATEFGAQPWFTVITVDGKPKCGATLVHKSWLIAPSSCILDNVRSLTMEYVAGVLSFSNQSMTVSSPTEQIKRVNSIDTVSGSLSYLHLESSVRPDHFTNPICTQISSPDPEDFNHAECHRVSFVESQISDTRVEIDVVRSEKNKHFAIKMDRRLCKENNASFVYCTLDGSTWFFTGFLDVFDEDQCNKEDFAKLFNPFYGENSENVFNTLGSPPMQNVPPPKCQGVRCSLGNCVEKAHVCDNIAQCADNEDEKRCSRHYLGIKSSGDDDEVEASHSSANESQIHCPVGHFQCRSTGNCIPISTWCDGVFDCGTDDLTDEPDESECTCRHYLALAAPERVCDNILHCPNREDEMEGCPCNEASFYCDKGNKTTTAKCFNQVFVCDGHEDCENGEDENHCLTLTTDLDEITPSMNEDGPDGFVVVKVKGVWHPYCSNRWSQELGSKLCSLLQPNSILDDVQTFDVTRFSFDTVLFVASDFNDEAEHKVVKLKEEEVEERFDGASSCELGYVRCIGAESK